ncbi:spore coat protein [Edaphobacillus lindanitolerans]|uniref:Spore coat protein CotF n=1 Tax=Edaphobacillus lindanitolerans TaxID=550447 RepID=A0A1U7PL49_9BACI|nr:spore coat protein [Edaphobacillus lindanitolerans]SIT87254.1 Spore coat protein CotF [Edaphobacillus lindanitolerans]
MTQNPFGQNQSQGQGQTHQNMHTGAVPQNMNHGGHELFDVHEVLSQSIAAMDQSTLLRQQAKDPELIDIMDRQYRFMRQEYNTLVDCFKSGQDPQVPTQSYKMAGGNDFVYGMKQSQPKKPMMSPQELDDAAISGFLLGSAKASATAKTAAALETTNPVVRRVLADSVPNCIEMAYELSIYQNKHHYYQVPQLAETDMQAILNAYAPATGNQPGMQ